MRVCASIYDDIPHVPEAEFDLAGALKALSLRESPLALDLGCGSGQLSRDLALRGFRCVAVDRSPPPTSVTDQGNITFIKGDLKTYDLGTKVYDLVIAKNVLQFFRPKDKRDIFNRAFLAVKPGGILLVEAFTVADPSHRLLERRGFTSAELHTFVHPKSGDVMSFFASQELQTWATEEGARILHYQEVSAGDDHPPHGKHSHGLAFLAATTPA